MPLQRPSLPRRSMLRSLAVLVALVVAVAACSSPGASSAWSYGPTLEPTASGSAAPSASAAPSTAPSPSPSVAASASPSATASARASGGASAPPAGAGTAITIGTRTGAETEFEPDELSVPTGGTVSVTFDNLSTLPHNLTFNAPISVASEPIVAPGASATLEFPAPEPGDYTFVCTLHPGMQGTLTVEPAG